jgi:hypothetical protein
MTARLSLAQNLFGSLVDLGGVKGLFSREIPNSEYHSTT